MRLLSELFSPPKQRLFLDEQRVPPKGLNGIRVSKTVQPKTKVTFNEVYLNAKNQLLTK